MKRFSCLLLIVIASLLLVGGVKAEDCYKVATYDVSYSSVKSKYKVEKDYCSNKKKSCYAHIGEKISTTYNLSKNNCSVYLLNKYIKCTKVSNNKCSVLAQENEVWNTDYNFSSSNGLAYIACGSMKKDKFIDNCNKANKMVYDVPASIPEITSFAVNLLKIATPIILIIVGIIQIIKAVSSTNEDEIKKAQGGLIKKVIIAVMIFMVISLTQFIINFIAEDSESSIANNCFKCFLNGNCPIKYYRTGVNGEKCESINTNSTKNNSTNKTKNNDKYYVIFLDATGGTIYGQGGVGSKQIEYGESYGEIPRPTRSGYEFVGWYTKKNGKGKKIESTSIFNSKENIHLYAYWKKVEVLHQNCTYSCVKGNLKEINNEYTCEVTETIQGNCNKKNNYSYTPARTEYVCELEGATFNRSSYNNEIHCKNACKKSETKEDKTQLKKDCVWE